jgi:glycosyltransferase involved in cell wall biosynthesis
MSGTSGFTHDPESVFEAARQLQGDANIHFLLSGQGVGWTKLQDMQAAMNLANVTLADYVPQSQLENFLAAADTWIIPYRKNNTGISVPSRIYNLLAVGRPVIICSEPEAEAALLVRENDIGWVVPPENPQALATAIREAASGAGMTVEKGRRAASVAPNYAREPALNAYKALVARLRARS